MLVQAMGRFAQTKLLQNFMPLAQKEWMGAFLSLQTFTGCILSEQKDNLVCLDEVNVQNPFDKTSIEKLKSHLVEKGYAATPATIILPPEFYQYFLIEDVLVEESHKLEAIQWRLTELIDYSVEDAVIDYMEIPQQESKKSKPLIYAFVTPKETILKVTSWARGCGINLKKLDVGQSAYKAYLSQKSDQSIGQLLLVLHPNQIELVIIKQGAICLMRKIEAPYLKESLVTNNIKESTYEMLCIEIQRSIDYCASIICQPSISNIYIQENLAYQIDIEKIKDILGLQVEALRPDKKELAVPLGVNSKEKLIAVGAAIGGLHETGD